MTNSLQRLIDNKVDDFDSGEFDFEQLSKYQLSIKNKLYFDFVVKSGNCGYFFEQSLHLYGYSHDRNFHDIEFVNTLLGAEYLEIISGLLSFGQDLFGNQFCFDTNTGSVILLDMESGERTKIAGDFGNWIEALFDRFDYFVGPMVLKAWLAHNTLNFAERLCPKIPFIMGGAFDISNLYAGIFPDYIKAYGNIAKQVYNLPDGQKVKIVFGKNPGKD